MARSKVAGLDLDFVELAEKVDSSVMFITGEAYKVLASRPRDKDRAKAFELIWERNVREFGARVDKVMAFETPSEDWKDDPDLVEQNQSTGPPPSTT